MILVLMIVSFGNAFAVEKFEGKNFNIDVPRKPDAFSKESSGKEARKINGWVYRWQDKERSIVVSHSQFPCGFSDSPFEGEAEYIILEIILSSILPSSRNPYFIPIKNLDKIALGVYGVDLYCIVEDDRLGTSFCRFRIIICQNQAWTVFVASPDHRKVNNMSYMFDSIKVFPGIVV
jgi:hypothetical protein